jgi:hypothetical protein
MRKVRDNTQSENIPCPFHFLQGTCYIINRVQEAGGEAQIQAFNNSPKQNNPRTL